MAATAETLLDAVVRQNDRQFDATDAGPCYTFDIDQTYLETAFESALGLLRIPFELAVDKRPYPAVPALIRACQRGTGQVGADRPIYFVSASPAQMRDVLRKRMIIDQITPDGITLKNWGMYLRQLRPRALRHQVPYKLVALLLNRAELPPKTYEVLFGDDTEDDRAIYTLYADIVAGRLRGNEILAVLEARHHATEADARVVATTAEKIAPAEYVHRVFIHHVRRRSQDRDRDDGFVYGYRSPLMPAAILYRDGLISGSSFAFVFRSLRQAGTVTLASAIDDVAAVLHPVASASDVRDMMEAPHAQWPEPEPKVRVTRPDKTRRASAI